MRITFSNIHKVEKRECRFQLKASHSRHAFAPLWLASGIRFGLIALPKHTGKITNFWASKLASYVLQCPPLSTHSICLGYFMWSLSLSHTNGPSLLDLVSLPLPLLTWHQSSQAESRARPLKLQAGGVAPLQTVQIKLSLLILQGCMLQFPVGSDSDFLLKTNPNPTEVLFSALDIPASKSRRLVVWWAFVTKNKKTWTTSFKQGKI